MTVSPAPQEYVRLPEAARLAGVRKSQLIASIETGKLKAVVIDGDLAVRPGDALNSLPKEQQPAYKQVAHLRGKSLGLSEAAHKYGLQTPTLSRWVKRGYVAKLGADLHHSQKILVDEADVAYCAAVYAQRGGAGHWIFNPDGTPYSPKPVAA